MIRYPLGIPFPKWDTALKLPTNRADVVALDDRLSAMDVMAVAIFPLEAWRPDMDAVIYQMVWNKYGGVSYHVRRGDIRPVD
jgi:hypothetical protein